MENWITLIYQLIGGLALFLFGMDVMTRALKASAGSHLKSFLHKMTKNRWRALLAGTGITAVIQSSSVTTVLAVGFVSAGLMSFESTLGLILGAGIGTTITAQIIALKITKIALLLVIVGYLFTLISKYDSSKELGNILIGLGVIFLGMNIMSEGMHPLKSYPPFIVMMQDLSNPVLGILVGALFTALVQSSSATTGVVIVMATQGLITGEGGISIIIGANIGTCVTAFLSAIGKPRAAMQVAIAHITFKVTGALLWVWFIPNLADITKWISPENLPRQIANAHTIFNIANAVILIGFTGPIGWIIKKAYPSRTPQTQNIGLLNNYYLQHPSLAIELVDKELNKLTSNINEIMINGFNIIIHGTSNDLEQFREKDKLVDSSQKQILAYLQQLQQKPLSKPDVERIKNQMEITNLLESAADVVTTSMVEAASHRIKHKLQINLETKKLFETIYERCSQSIVDAVYAYLKNTPDQAKLISKRKGSINQSIGQLKERLFERLSEDDTNRIDLIRFETELLESIGRLFTIAKRIANLQISN